jgi:hypothetical protein
VDFAIFCAINLSLQLTEGRYFMKLWARCSAGFLGIVTMLSLAAWAPAAFAQDAEVASSPDVKEILQVAGTWTGSIDTDQDGSGTLTLTIAQDKKKLSGDFTTDISGGHSGPLTGKVAGDHVNLKLVDTGGGDNCKVKIMATVSGSDMSGVLLVHGGKHCKGKGTVDLALQP